MITRILAVLSLAAISFHSVAHDEYSAGSTEIEFYQIELSPNEKLKLSQLNIYFENEYHGDEGAIDPSSPPPAQNTINETHDFSLITL